MIKQMTPGVEWPRAFKGGFMQGHDAVRSYWENQWSEIDPRVEPVSIEPLDDGRVDVEVAYRPFAICGWQVMAPTVASQTS